MQDPSDTASEFPSPVPSAESSRPFPAARGLGDDPQLTLEGRVKPTRSGGEVIVFEIPLAFVRLVCIVSIPDDDTDRAPVYVKFKIARRTA